MNHPGQERQLKPEGDINAGNLPDGHRVIPWCDHA